MQSNDRYVVKHGKQWAVKKSGATRSSGVFDLQSDAAYEARRIVGNLGGGEVRIQGRNGQFRESDTVRPG
jgi:hypothetical protein